MADLFEVLLVDGDRTWHAGWIVDDESETDLLLRDRGDLLVFDTRAGLEYHVQERGLELLPDLPDEIDLRLGGWLTGAGPQPDVAAVSELWHLLFDDPVAGHALAGEELGEAYDDLVEETAGWFEAHGEQVRVALQDAVTLLMKRVRTG
ncbi:MAG: hypothetical protein JWO27_292 [Frankiales bacterium]|jgi:hypothetical protein|nr:hypothetical protein [Frankiales bacterium]MCW2707963.1 hypothetical protein [Frankiales bacterium]